MKSIDELKKYVRLHTKEMFCKTSGGNERLVDVVTCDEGRISDLIEQVESEVMESGSTPSVGEAIVFSERVREAVENGDDVTLFGVDYMPFPVDNQGRVINPGDRVYIKSFANPHEVTGVGRKFGKLSAVWFDDGTWELAGRIESHATPPSPVEEMLGEMYERLCASDGEDVNKTTGEIIGEYAARLKLKDEE